METGPGTVLLTVASGSFAGAIENSGGQLALLKTGNGQLILSGANDYTGGTTVTGGTLVITNPMALPEGSSLFVGAGASSLFSPSLDAAPVVGMRLVAEPAAVAAAVPEPGTWALLAAAGIVAAAGRKRRMKGIASRADHACTNARNK